MLQSFTFIIHKMWLQILAARLQRRRWEREKEWGEIWAAWSCTENRFQNEGPSFKGEKERETPCMFSKCHSQNEGPSFKGEKERETPCMFSKCHSQKREAYSKGGHHERGEVPLGEETQKWGKKPSFLSLNLSLMPQGVTQGVEWAPHMVPITKSPIQWRW
jgi:hypothetical protein